MIWYLVVRTLTGAVTCGFGLVFGVPLRDDGAVHAWAWRQLPLRALGATGWAMERPDTTAGS